MNGRTPKWFVVDYYSPSVATKMENQLMNWAREKWLNCAVYETSLEDLVKALKSQQNRILEENRRLKPVAITLDKFYRYSPIDVHRHLSIGSCHFTLRKIRNEFNDIDIISA